MKIRMSIEGMDDTRPDFVPNCLFEFDPKYLLEQFEETAIEVYLKPMFHGVRGAVRRDAEAAAKFMMDNQPSQNMILCVERTEDGTLCSNAGTTKIDGFGRWTCGGPHCK